MRKFRNMGNLFSICGDKAKYSDLQVIQTWLPSVAEMFIFTGESITAVNMSFFSGDLNAAICQLSALLDLLKGKFGVTNSTLDSIRSILEALKTNGFNTNKVSYQPVKMIGKVNKEDVPRTGAYNTLK